MDNITANEVAGLGVGTLLLCASLAAPKIDAFISSSQRRTLGMCNKCGDVKLIACQSCKGVGSFPPGGLFGFNPMGNQPNPKPVACAKCRSRGHFPCPQCSSSSSSSSSFISG